MCGAGGEQWCAEREELWDGVVGGHSPAVQRAIDLHQVPSPPLPLFSPLTVSPLLTVSPPLLLPQPRSLSGSLRLLLSLSCFFRLLLREQGKGERGRQEGRDREKERKVLTCRGGAGCGGEGVRARAGQGAHCSLPLLPFRTLRAQRQKQDPPAGRPRMHLSRMLAFTQRHVYAHSSHTPRPVLSYANRPHPR